MEFRADTRRPLARLALGLMALAFTPGGAWVLRGAFGETAEPHAFVMLVFSGCLILLLGLVGLIGFVASFWPKR